MASLFLFSGSFGANKENTSKPSNIFISSIM